VTGIRSGAAVHLVSKMRVRGHSPGTTGRPAALSARKIGAPAPAPVAETVMARAQTNFLADAA
jgi:hypothetical protein